MGKLKQRPSQTVYRKCLPEERVLQKTVVQCSSYGLVFCASSLFFIVLNH